MPLSSNRLRVLRAERDITQMDVARRVLGIGLYRYWSIEHGYMDPTPKEVRKLARFFRVDGAAIFPDLVQPPVEAEP